MAISSSVSPSLVKRCSHLPLFIRVVMATLVLLVWQTLAVAKTAAPTKQRARAANGSSHGFLAVKVGVWSWLETYKVSDGTATRDHNASLMGTSFSLQYQRLLARSAWAGEVSLISGRANGAPQDSSVFPANNSDRVPWSAIVFTPTYFARLSPRVKLGLGAPLILRNLKWTTDDESLNLEASPSFAYSFMVQNEIILGSSWMLQQSLGVHGVSKKIMYNLALGYIIP